MYKILSLVFGWDYIIWRNSCDSGIARIRKSQNNVVWYYRYKLTKVVDKVQDPNQVIWLTCHPSKYLPTND